MITEMLYAAELRPRPTNPHDKPLNLPAHHVTETSVGLLTRKHAHASSSSHSRGEDVQEPMSNWRSFLAGLPRVILITLMPTMVPLLSGMIPAAQAQIAEAILSEVTALVEQVEEFYRRYGRPDPEKTAAAERLVRSALTRSPSPTTRSELLIALTRLERLTNRCDQALVHLTEAKQLATSSGRGDLQFKAEIGIVRCSIALRNHDAASTAMEKAQEAAGANPERQQIADLAYYRSEMLLARGEPEAALPWAARAIRAADTPKGQVVAHLQSGNTFYAMVQQCEYEFAIERCRGAMEAAQRSYVRAEAIARRANWDIVTEMAASLRGDVDGLFSLHERGWQILRSGYTAKQFAPLYAGEVLANREFGASPGTISEAEFKAAVDQMWYNLGEVSKTAMREMEAATGDQMSSSQVVKGIEQEAKGNHRAAMLHYLKAVELIERERGNFFDLRNRGTTIAVEKKTYETPALRLLRAGREADAFRLLELARARGLAELSTLGDDASISEGDFAAVATLLELEAELTDMTRSFVDAAIKAGDLPLDHSDLDKLATLEARRRQLAISLTSTLTRLAARPRLPPATLEALEEASVRTRTPVLLYWTTRTGVVAWYVGPQGSKPLNIFLPIDVLKEKVEAVRKSSKSMGIEFDRYTARELFLFLVSPLFDLLTDQAVLIVPHGPLVGLPFEALIDPRDGRYLAEQLTISYAPNATLALAALNRSPRIPRQVLAVYNIHIDAETAAIDRVAQAFGVGGFRRLKTEGLTREALTSQLANADVLHLLAHGKFETEPLRSTIDLFPGQPKTTAAALLGFPLRGLSLAVLSSCETGIVTETLSNEIFGIPWALLVGGVDAAVVARWIIKAEETATWMEHFYYSLANGQPPSQSATFAMRRMLVSPSTSHPYFWAGMQVIGR